MCLVFSVLFVGCLALREEVGSLQIQSFENPTTPSYWTLLWGLHKIPDPLQVEVLWVILQFHLVLRKPSPATMMWYCHLLTSINSFVTSFCCGTSYSLYVCASKPLVIALFFFRVVFRWNSTNLILAFNSSQGWRDLILIIRSLKASVVVEMVLCVSHFC